MTHPNPIPFQDGHATVRVFARNDIIDAGLNASMDPNESLPQDLHYWNTLYGYYDAQDPPNKYDLIKRALSDWLMAQGVPTNTMVILESQGFQASWED